MHITEACPSIIPKKLNTPNTSQKRRGLRLICHRLVPGRAGLRLTVPGLSPSSSFLCLNSRRITRSGPNKDNKGMNNQIPLIRCFIVCSDASFPIPPCAKSSRSLLTPSRCWCRRKCCCCCCCCYCCFCRALYRQKKKGEKKRNLNSSVYPPFPVSKPSSAGYLRPVRMATEHPPLRPAVGAAIAVEY